MRVKAVGTMKKINISCFLNNEEKVEVKQYIKKLLKNPDAEFFESGGLGVRVERTATWAMFDVYRIVGTAEVRIPRKKSPPKKKRAGAM